MEHKQDYIIDSHQLLTTDPYNDISKSGGMLKLKINGKLILKRHGKINVTGLGFNSECKHEGRGEDGIPYGGGGGHATQGQNARISIRGSGGKSINKNIVLSFGSAGGNGGGSIKTIGGSGGGIILIECDELIMEKYSSIVANGRNGEFRKLKSAAGGGSGGTIQIITNKLKLHPSAKIEAKGGVGHGNMGKGGDGSHGRTLICLTQDRNIDMNNFGSKPTIS